MIYDDLAILWTSLMRFALALRYLHNHRVCKINRKSCWLYDDLLTSADFADKSNVFALGTEVITQALSMWNQQKNFGTTVTSMRSLAVTRSAGRWCCTWVMQRADTTTDCVSFSDDCCITGRVLSDFALTSVPVTPWFFLFFTVAQNAVRWQIKPAIIKGTLSCFFFLCKLSLKRTRELLYSAMTRQTVGYVLRLVYFTGAQLQLKIMMVTDFGTL